MTVWAFDPFFSTKLTAEAGGSGVRPEYQPALQAEIELTSEPEKAQL